MTIFGDARLGRIAYVIVLVLMFAFDFAKAPIEHAIMAMHDQAANELMQPHPVTNFDQPEAGKINGRTMPLMLKGQEDAIREIVNSKAKLSRAEIEEKMRVATLKSIANFETNHPASPEIKRLADTRSFFATLYPIAVIAMTGITVVGLLWMVSSRVRDIGWPQFVLWILLAPVFLPKFIHLPLSEAASHGISLFFYTGLFALAFTPGENGRTATPIVSMRTVAVAAKPQAGRFGKLGTQ